MMTFEEFQATKQSCGAEKMKRIGYTPGEEGEFKPEGFVYVNLLVIEKTNPGWPCFRYPRTAQGAYYLRIGNLEWITDDLELLEKRLYEFAKSSGLVEEAP